MEIFDKEYQTKPTPKAKGIIIFRSFIDFLFKILF